MAEFLRLLLENAIYMKKGFLPLISLLLLISCQTYQYATVDSTLQKNDEGEIVLENDSVLIKYRFNGYYCPAVVRVYNKLPVPIYIDWKRSAFILSDGRTLTQAPETASINGVATGYEMKFSDLTSISQTELSGTISRASDLAFLPPTSFIESAPVTLRDTFFTLPTGRLTTFRVPGNTYALKGRVFGQSDSPMKFRSYLTVSTHEDLSDPFVFDTGFWVSEVGKSSNAPATMVARNSNDQFYLTKPTGVGPFLGVAVLIALILAAAAN